MTDRQSAAIDRRLQGGSRVAGSVWDEATRVLSSRLVYPDARAALAHARRADRITAPALRRAVREIEGLVAQLDLVELDGTLAARAGALAEAHALRGYDAVHLASAELAADDELVLVAGNARLLHAAQSIGLATAATGSR